MIKVEHWSNGNIKYIEMRNEEGGLHNPNGPADQWWYADGQEKSRSYCVDNVYHNPNGPALQKWFKNGVEECRSYWVDGERHNLNGPARQEWYGDGREEKALRQYWVEGNSLPETKFKELQNAVAKFKEFQNSVEVTCGDKTVRISKAKAVELGLIDKPKSTKN